MPGGGESAPGILPLLIDHKVDIRSAAHRTMIAPRLNATGHGGRAMILCAAGDIHGALDRLFEDVLASRSRSALRGEREEDAALPVSWRRWTPVIQRARR